MNNMERSMRKNFGSSRGLISQYKWRLISSNCMSPEGIDIEFYKRGQYSALYFCFDRMRPVRFISGDKELDSNLLENPDKEINEYYDYLCIYKTKLKDYSFLRNENIQQSIEKNKINNLIVLGDGWKCFDSVSTIDGSINIDLYKKDGFSIMNITFDKEKPVGFLYGDEIKDLRYLQNPKRWINYETEKNTYNGGAFIFDLDLPYLSFYKKRR